MVGGEGERKGEGGERTSGDSVGARSREGGERMELDDKPLSPSADLGGIIG